MLKLVEKAINAILEDTIVIREKNKEEKREKKERRLEIVRKKQENLKEKLVKRAIETLIIHTIEEVMWRNEIEEEINRDKETEKMRESGSHILRKRKLNRKNKYKEVGEKLERKPVIKKMKTEATQRKLVKAGKRKPVNMEKGESEKKKETSLSFN